MGGATLPTIQAWAPVPVPVTSLQDLGLQMAENAPGDDDDDWLDDWLCRYRDHQRTLAQKITQPPTRRESYLATNRPLSTNIRKSCMWLAGKLVRPCLLTDAYPLSSPRGMVEDRIEPGRSARRSHPRPYRSAAVYHTKHDTRPRVGGGGGIEASPERSKLPVEPLTGRLPRLHPGGIPCAPLDPISS